MRKHEVVRVTDYNVANDLARHRQTMSATSPTGLKNSTSSESPHLTSHGEVSGGRVSLGVMDCHSEAMVTLVFGWRQQALT